jgi:hypothetical protein
MASPIGGKRVILVDALGSKEPYANDTAIFPR